MLRLQPASLVIPECVAVAVEANGLLVVRQRVDFHHGQGVSHKLFAGVAPLPVAWTPKHSRGAVTRQATGPELRQDENTDGFRVHGGLTCGDHPNHGTTTKRPQPELL